MFELDDFLFDNVGKKIKSIIRVSFYIAVGLIALSTAYLEIRALIDLFDTNYGIFFLYLLLIPIVAVLSIIVLWLSCLTVYGFAEIVDTAITNRKSENGDKPKNLTDYCAEYKKDSQATAPSQPAPTSTAPAGVMKDGWLCTCGKLNPQYMSSCSCGKTAREIREMNKK